MGHLGCTSGTQQPWRVPRQEAEDEAAKAPDSQLKSGPERGPPPRLRLWML